jgi:glycosyltransferase involved in cell wall biosynthesis
VKRASIIIPTRNRAQSLQEALRGYGCQDLSPESYEVLVVDNGSTDNTNQVVEEISASHPHVRCVREERPGLHFARHCGAKNAIGEILLYGEDDMEVRSDWASSMLDCLADETVHAVTGRVLAKWNGEPPAWMQHLDKSFLGVLDLGEGTFEVPADSSIRGGNLAIRRESLFGVGGFNPDGFPKDRWHYRGDGESGLLSKLRQAGHRVLYTSRATGLHNVPLGRLTPDYVRDRFHMEGISRSFAVCRDVQGRKLRLLADAVISCLRIPPYWLSAAGDRKIRSTAMTSYLSARAQHDWRLLSDPALVEYVLSETFLS